MAHYAYLDPDNVVTEVIVGKDEDEDGTDWEQYYGAVRCSYNTQGGVHYDPATGEPSADQSKALRGNYPGPGYVFHPEVGDMGVFSPPRPYPSWILNPATALWEPPVAEPDDSGNWRWDEDAQDWVAL